MPHQSTESKTLLQLHVLMATLVVVAALQVKTIGGSTLAICTYKKYIVPVFLALLHFYSVGY